MENLSMEIMDVMWNNIPRLKGKLLIPKLEKKFEGKYIKKKKDLLIRINRFEDV